MTRYFLDRINRIDQTVLKILDAGYWILDNFLSRIPGRLESLSSIQYRASNIEYYFSYLVHPVKKVKWKDLDMNQINLQKLTAPPNSWHMLRTMGGVGILCALLIVFTYQATLSTIKENRAEALERAVFNVLPGAETKQTFKLSANNTFEPFTGEARGEKLVYAGYDAQNQLVGIALEAKGQGFQDAIHIIYGYSPDKQAVVGMQVLESKETPGLGDKIEKDPAFVSNFDALDVSLAENDNTLKNPVTFVKKGNKEHPWQIEGITGATVSSKAIAKIMDQSTREWVPLLMNNLNQFRNNPL